MVFYRFAVFFKTIIQRKYIAVIKLKTFTCRPDVVQYHSRLRNPFPKWRGAKLGSVDAAKAAKTSFLDDDPQMENVEPAAARLNAQKRTSDPSNTRTN
jgi:hypothetical protein